MKPVRHIAFAAAVVAALTVTSLASALADPLYPAWVNQRVAYLKDWVPDNSKFTIDENFTPPIHNQSTDMNNLDDGAWRVFTFRRDYFPAGASVTFAFRHDPQTHVEELWTQNFSESHPIECEGRLKCRTNMLAPRVIKSHWSYATRQGSSEGIQAPQTTQVSTIDKQKQMLDEVSKQRSTANANPFPPTARTGGASCRKTMQNGVMTCGGWPGTISTWSFSGGATMAGCPAGSIQSNYRETESGINYDCFATQ